MCLFPRLPCGEGRLIGEFRPDGWTLLGARNRTRNLPRPWRFLWRRPYRYATLASVRGTEITIWQFQYLGPMLNTGTRKVAGSIPCTERCPAIRAELPNQSPLTTEGDEEICTWPGLSESSGPKYPASHGMYFCGDALTGMLL